VSDENVPAEIETPAETKVEVIGQRQGMFGVSGSGDTSGYGGLVSNVELPGASTPPYDDGGWMDDVAGKLATATRDAGVESAVEKVALLATPTSAMKGLMR
jgi:NADH-quinone oxidoreductase subunit C